MTLSIGEIMGRNKRFGFSLVEILLVIVLLSVIAGLALPNFRPAYQKIQLKQTGWDLVYLMRYAQSRAIVKNNNVQLRFENDFSKYWLMQEIKEDDFLDARYERIPSRLGRTFHIPKGITLESQYPIINFFPDSKIDKLRIYVCHKEQCMTISTKEQRGFVKIFEERID